MSSSTMSLMAHISRHFFFPLLAMYERSSIRRHLRQLEESQYHARDQLEELRIERLRRLLIHASENCPFYRRRFADAGFDPSSLRSMEDLRVLPTLTKQDIQEFRAQIRATNLPLDQLLPDKTGGSTGRPLHFYYDRDRLYSRNAAALRHDRWTGWDIGERSAYLWGHREDMNAWQGIKARLRNALVERRIFLDTTDISPDRMREFDDRLRSFRPKIFVAYANSIYLYAHYLEESGVDDFFRPTGIITSAELLIPERRKVIERVFGCPVYDRYGSRETGIIGSECEVHNGMHLCAETIHLEIVRKGRPVEAGETGKIVITDLLNFGFPLIRYQIEDVGQLVTGGCTCGRSLPLFRVSGGRVTDFLITARGKIISGASLTIYLIANTPGLKQAQLIQKKKDEIVMRAVTDDIFQADGRAFLDRELPKFLGRDTRVIVEEVDAIPSEPSGKYRFSISELDPRELF